VLSYPYSDDLLLTTDLHGFLQVAGIGGRFLLGVELIVDVFLHERGFPDSALAKKDDLIMTL